jgi:hypothetical protein
VAISWNTGTTVDDNNSNQATQVVTIPAGVLAGDLILVMVTGWDSPLATETIQASSTGTAPVIIGTSQSVSFSGDNLQGALFYIVASASDPGKVITTSFVSGDLARWSIALGAWTGVSNSRPVDVSGAATASGASSSLTCPTEVTTVNGDWCIQAAAVALGGSAYTGGSGFTQRESVVDSNSGGGAFIYDSNGPAGAGQTIGGAVFSNAGHNSWWAGFTVGLAPYIPQLPQPLLRGRPAAVRGALTAGAPAVAVVQAPVSLNPSPQPQPGGKAWRARFRRRQAPWLQPGPPPVTAGPVATVPPPLRGRGAAVKGRLTGLAAPPPVIPGPPAPFYPPHGLLRGPAARVLARLTGFAVPTPRPPRASPFYPPHLPLRGPAAAALARLTGQRGRPSTPAPFTPPHMPLRGGPSARPGRLAGLAAPPPVLHPAVASIFKLPGYPLYGPAAARKGGVAGVVAPPPVTQPNIPAPFTPPHLLLRGPVPAAPRTKTTGAIAPPPAPPPVAPPHWQGSTHMIAATATGNLIQGANHTGRGGPGTDLKGDYERSGD